VQVSQSSFRLPAFGNAVATSDTVGRPPDVLVDVLHKFRRREVEDLRACTGIALIPGSGVTARPTLFTRRESYE